MTVNDLKMGGIIRMGFYNDMPIEWAKVRDDNKFISIRRVGYLPFDDREERSTREEVRRCGNGFYPESNINQWLNASGENWFKPQNDEDILAREFTGLCGFMDRFTESEKQCLQLQTIHCAVPAGKVKKYGNCVVYNCYVALPSIGELIYNHCCAEAMWEDERVFVDATEKLQNRNILTRTPMKTPGKVYKLMRRLDATGTSVPALYSAGINPVIQLKPETMIDDDFWVYIQREESDFMSFIMA